MTPDPEVQAILALCHHNDNYFHTECEACRFRQQAGIEHIQSLVSSAVVSLSGDTQ